MNDKTNHRPISLLPIISKIFEKVFYPQLETAPNNIFSRKLCGFRKGYSLQNSLCNLLNNWQKSLDTSGVVGTVLMDLSKAYGCLPHDVLIAKLTANGFNNTALVLITDYLTNRIQWGEIGSAFSSCLEILRSISQGSVLGPILFNLFLNDLMFFIKETEVCNFAYDTTEEAHRKLLNSGPHVPENFCQIKIFSSLV